MDNLRVIVTLLIVAAIALLSVFQMQMRGYDKVGRIEEWVLYVDEPEICPSENEKIFEDEIASYFTTCALSEDYIVKSGFEERGLIYALDEGLITIEDLNELIALNIIEK